MYVLFRARIRTVAANAGREASSAMLDENRVITLAILNIEDLN